MPDASKLPDPCPKCVSTNGVGILVERNGYSSIALCDCDRARAIQERKAAASVPIPETAEPLVDGGTAAAFCEMLAVIPFFPSEPGARLMVAKELQSLCSSPAEMNWLVTRMVRLYKKWPGCHEMRTLFCQKYRPLCGPDHTNAISEVYPDGIPGSQALLPDPPLLALPAGEVSAAPSLNAAITDLARLKDLNRLGPDPRVREIPAVKITDKNRITQADIQRAIELRREGVYEQNHNAS